MVWFTADLCESRNTTTGQFRFYVNKCGVFQRISESEYNQRRLQAEFSKNFRCKTVRGVQRYYITIIWEERL